MGDLHMTAVGATGASSSLFLVGITLKDTTGNDISPIDTSHNAATIVAGSSGPSLEALPSLVPATEGTDHASGILLDLQGVRNTGTNQTSSDALDSYQAHLAYNPSCIQLDGLRQRDFSLSGTHTDVVGGSATFDGTATISAQATRSQLGFAAVSLIGAANQPCTVALGLSQGRDGQGRLILAGTSTETFLRGDANSDGQVNAADAQSIAKELVGQESGCTGASTASCVNQVNAASVHHDGTTDQITVTDALYIAQEIAGVRNNTFGLVAK